MRPPPSLAVLACLAGRRARRRTAADRAPDVGPHLETLAGDRRPNGGNRSAGRSGEAETAAVIAQRLEALGWRVTRQPVPFPYWEERTPPVVHDLVPGRDVLTVRIAATATSPRGSAPPRLGLPARRRARLPPRRDRAAAARRLLLRRRRAAAAASRREGRPVLVAAGRRPCLLPATLGARSPHPGARRTTQAGAGSPRARAGPRQVDGVQRAPHRPNVIAERPARGRAGRHGRRPPRLGRRGPGHQRQRQRRRRAARGRRAPRADRPGCGSGSGPPRSSGCTARAATSARLTRAERRQLIASTSTSTWSARRTAAPAGLRHRQPTSSGRCAAALARARGGDRPRRRVGPRAVPARRHPGRRRCSPAPSRRGATGAATTGAATTRDNVDLRDRNAKMRARRAATRSSALRRPARR